MLGRRVDMLASLLHVQRVEMLVSPHGRKVKIHASRRRGVTLGQRVETLASLPRNRIVETLASLPRDRMVEMLGQIVETLASLPRDRMVETLGQIVETFASLSCDRIGVETLGQIVEMLGHRVETFGCRVEMLGRMLETLASLPPYQRVEIQRTENGLELKWKEIVCYTKSLTVGPLPGSKYSLSEQLLYNFFKTTPCFGINRYLPLLNFSSTV